MPEASVPSRFLEEVPPQLVEELAGAATRSFGFFVYLQIFLWCRRFADRNVRATQAALFL